MTAYRHYLGLPATLSMKQYTCALKVVMGLPWERFPILIICMVILRSFPFFLLLCHYTLLMSLEKIFAVSPCRNQDPILLELWVPKNGKCQF